MIKYFFKYFLQNSGQHNFSAARKAFKITIVTILSASVFMGSVIINKETALAVDKAALQKSIDENKAAISEANREKSSLQNGLTDIKKLVASLESSKNDLNAYVTKLDKDLSNIQEKIAELKELIEEKELEIEKAQAALEEARIIEQEQYEAMKQRIRFMYEQGENYFMELLLTSHTLGDLMSRTEYVEKVTAYDREKLEEFAAARENVEVLEQQLNAQLDVLGEAKSAADKEEAAMNTLIAEKEAQIKVYEADISDKSAQIKEYEAEIAERNAIIAALEAAVRESQKALDEADRPKYDGGKFTWPVPSYTRISSDYGNRMHPTLGVEKFHNGVDMAAANGAAILAAYSGTVVAADYNASMGNYMMIDHGDGIYTIYMHCSSLGVSKGTKVSQGQQIGKVGSTGRSTGPHLHFSVRVNGNYVSPWNYLK